MGIFSAYFTIQLQRLYPSLLSTPEGIKSFYYSKKKNSIMRRYSDFLISGAVLPSILPVQDFRKRKNENDYDDIKIKKIIANIETKKGFRLGSKHDSLTQ